MSCAAPSYTNFSTPLNVSNTTNLHIGDVVIQSSTAWIVIFFILCISASTVNFVLGFSVLNRKQTRKGANILVAIILLMQSFASVVAYPAYALPLYGGLLGCWRAPAAYCNVVMVIFLSLFGIIIWLETILAINRLCAVVFPHEYRTWYSAKFLTLITSLAIFFGTVWSIPPVFGVSGGYFRNRLGVCSFAQINLAGVMVTAVGTYIPMSISGLCYIVLGTKVLFNQLKCLLYAQPSVRSSTNMTRKRQAFALVTFVQYFIDAAGFLTIPVFVASMPEVYNRSPEITVWLRFSYTCGFLIIPVILLTISPQYRQAVALALRQCIRRGITCRRKPVSPEKHPPATSENPTAS